MIKGLYLSNDIKINNEKFEENLGLYTNDNKYNFMAELLADLNDVSIKVVKFAATDKNEVVRRNEYGFKCLAVALDQVLNYMEAINDTKVKLGTHQREEETLFDFAVFKEAWQNALLHTKWQRKNPPAVYIFSDRIEIISTGGLAQGLSKEEFFRGISHPVNAKLQKIFGQLGYVEQTGHGIPFIISRYGMQAFEVMDNFLNVTIPFNNAVAQKPRYDIPKIQEPILMVSDSAPNYFDTKSYSRVMNTPRGNRAYKVSDTVINKINDTISDTLLNTAQQALLAFFQEHPRAIAEDAAVALSFSTAYIRKMIIQLY